VDSDFRHEYLLSKITSQHCCGGSETFICRLPYEELGLTITDVICHAIVLEIICQISLKRFKALKILKKVFCGAV
jgi:hypothetical protein